MLAIYHVVHAIITMDESISFRFPILYVCMFHQTDDEQLWVVNFAQTKQLFPKPITIVIHVDLSFGRDIRDGVHTIIMGVFIAK